MWVRGYKQNTIHEYSHDAVSRAVTTWVLCGAFAHVVPFSGYGSRIPCGPQPQTIEVSIHVGL